MSAPTHLNSRNQPQEGSWSDPAVSFLAITPHATNPLTVIPRAVFVGGTGALVVRGENDAADVTFSAIPAGTILPISPKWVRATSTATLLIGLN